MSITLKTKIRIIALALFLAFGFSVKASIILPDTDSLPAKAYKISRQQFLAQYGKDDTAKAIINYYFSQRKKKRNVLIIFSGITAAGGLALANANFGTKPGTDSAGYIVLFLLLLGFIGLLFTFLLITLLAIADLLSFSRRRLYSILTNYNSGGGMKQKLRRKIIFYMQRH